MRQVVRTDRDPGNHGQELFDAQDACRHLDHHPEFEVFLLEEAFLSDPLPAGSKLIGKPHKREHEFDVFQAGVPDPLHGLQLQPEDLGLFQVAAAAPESQHGVLFLFFVLLAALQPGVLVRFQVQSAVEHRPGRKASRHLPQPIGKHLDEFLRSAFGEQLPRVHPQG